MSSEKSKIRRKEPEILVLLSQASLGTKNLPRISASKRVLEYTLDHGQFKIYKDLKVEPNNIILYCKYHNNQIWE